MSARRIISGTSPLLAALGLAMLGGARLSPGPGKALKVEGLPTPESVEDMDLRLRRLDKAAERRERRAKKRLRR